MDYKLALLFGVLVLIRINTLSATGKSYAMRGNDVSSTYLKEINTLFVLLPDLANTSADVDSNPPLSPELYKILKQRQNGIGKREK